MHDSTTSNYILEPGGTDSMALTERDPRTEAPVRVERMSLSSPLQAISNGHLPRGPFASRRRPRHSRGQSVVEFALIVPLFMLLVLSALDFGRMFFTYIQISNAAREAVAYGANNPTDTAGMTSHATQEVNVQNQGGENAITVAAACVDTAGGSITCGSAGGGAGPGNTITVTVSEPFTFLSPVFRALFPSFTIGTSASSVAMYIAPSSTATNPPLCSPPSSAVITISGAGLQIEADGSGSLPNSGLCAISGYNWDWADGTTGVSFATGATHTYAGPGVHIITLTVTNQTGSASTQASVTVPLSTTCLAPRAVFSIAPATGKAGSGATTFGYDANASVNMATSACNPHYAWSFGDGNTGPDAVTTTHQYGAASSGHTVLVRLTATNDAGTSQATQSIVLQ